MDPNQNECIIQLLLRIERKLDKCFDNLKSKIKIFPLVNNNVEVKVPKAENYASERAISPVNKNSLPAFLLKLVNGDQYFDKDVKSMLSFHQLCQPISERIMAVQSIKCYHQIIWQAHNDICIISWMVRVFLFQSLYNFSRC